MNLPRSLACRYYFAYAHILDTLTEESSVDRIPIPQKVIWCRVPGKRSQNLLTCPFSRRVGSHIEVNYLSASATEDYQDEEYPESGGRDCKEIHGDHAGHVIFQKATPGLRRRFGTPGRHKV